MIDTQTEKEKIEDFLRLDAERFGKKWNESTRKAHYRSTSIRGPGFSVRVGKTENTIEFYSYIQLYTPASVHQEAIEFTEESAKLFRKMLVGNAEQLDGLPLEKCEQGLREIEYKILFDFDSKTLTEQIN